MGYNTEKQEFFGAWDLYAEQFMMYVLGVVSKTHPVDASIFYDFGVNTIEPIEPQGGTVPFAVWVVLFLNPGGQPIAPE